MSLHWLPINAKSTYKIACMCCHCHNSTAPSCVTEMLQKKPSHTRNNRSSSCTMPLLNRPAHSKATLGDRSFSFASFVWNCNPDDVSCGPSLTSYMSRLKTYIRTYLHTYVLTYIRTYIHTYLLTYIHTYLHTYVLHSFSLQ